MPPTMMASVEVAILPLEMVKLYMDHMKFSGDETAAVGVADPNLENTGHAQTLLDGVLNDVKHLAETYETLEAVTECLKASLPPTVTMETAPTLRVHLEMSTDLARGLLRSFVCQIQKTIPYAFKGKKRAHDEMSVPGDEDELPPNDDAAHLAAMLKNSVNTNPSSLRADPGLAAAVDALVNGRPDAAFTGNLRLVRRMGWVTVPYSRTGVRC